jgi:hypothetical protein
VPKSDSYAPVRLNDLLFLAGAVTADGHPSDAQFLSTSRLSMEVIRENKQGCHAKCE